MIHLTRKETFSAAHKMFNVDWTAEKNGEVFGRDSNLHGHTYHIHVTVKGDSDLGTGCIIDIKRLSNITKKFIIDKCDHKNLNEDVDFLKGIMPSTENIAVAFWNQLNQPIELLGCKLHCVKVCESENNFSEYFGD